MYVFYEEDGDIKAGTILADNDTSLQLESQHGKRTKVKAANVLLRYPAPAPAEAMETARKLAAEIDTDFLWEVAAGSEFGFADLAVEYHGKTPNGPEAGAVLLCLHSAPIYFYKKGKGRYKAAPAEALAAAKAGLERKAREAELRAEWTDQLKSGGLPEAFRAKVFELAHKPDKNSLEYKALLDACGETGLSPVRLLDKCGAIPSSQEFHLQAFLLEHFPRGFGFPELAPPEPPPELPAGDAPAFSIDDAATTEIDDAFSVIFRPGGGARVGIHIAAPALGIAPGSELDRLAATRLSTVYMPGGKITMLPEGLVDRYTLAENRDCPALSLYVEVAADSSIVSLSTQADVIRIAANLRHETLEPLFNEDTIRNPAAADYPFRQELEWLWGFACHLEAARGKADQVQRMDYNFKVVDDRVSIIPRVRGNPIDKLVSELMILANSRWGKLLADHEVAGMYRAQSQGKVRMTLRPAPHEGLGLECYAWSTSPLRRYVDLINQRQILAAARGDKPVYAGNDPMLFAAMRDFELAYDAYNDFQRKMERYWCLRWLIQEGIAEMEAVVLKENLVRLTGLPMVTRVVGAPALNPGDAIRVAVADFDLLDNELSCRYLASAVAA
ncbi:MAG: RNB domain-containing ribonuclease [Gallionellaceae bacterium]|nr:RNB domain-containing ribonuclease [Gallionellaceae bacterium]MDD5365129.1 RNB domain-containing ribonuclease [Gallionellaceae bacterium]